MAGASHGVLAQDGLFELGAPACRGGGLVGRKAPAKAVERRDRGVNCPTSFLVSGPRGRAYGLYGISPFCWARLVERIRRGIDTAFFQPVEPKRWERDKANHKNPSDRFLVETMGPADINSPPPVRPKGPTRLPRSERFDLIEWTASSDE